LHYTIGTRVTTGVQKDLDEFGIKQVHVHPEPPPFKPVMLRGITALQKDPDWATRHLGSGLEKATLDAVHRGATADAAGTSFVPALALSPNTFARTGLTKGWNPADLGGKPDDYYDADDEDD
jgi:hypothetical protein